MVVFGMCSIREFYKFLVNPYYKESIIMISWYYEQLHNKIAYSANKGVAIGRHQNVLNWIDLITKAEKLF